LAARALPADNAISVAASAQNLKTRRDTIRLLIGCRDDRERATRRNQAADQDRGR
jgi:hypothetical protein